MIQPSGASNAAHLDAGECFVKFLGNRSHFLHSAGEADLFAVVVDLSNRRDNGCGTAETALCEIFDFVEAYFSFLDLKSEIIFRYSDKRTTGNGRKNAVRLRSNDFAVFGDEDEVCSAGLLDLGSGSSIQVHVLIEALAMCLHDGIKAHSIVQACLDVTGSVRCCTVIIGNADGDGFCTAFEVRANRGGEYAELIFLSGFYTDDSAASEHIRTDV